MFFGPGPIGRARVLVVGGDREPFPEIGEDRLEVVVAGLHAGGSLGELLEEPMSQGQLHRELLLHQLGVAFSLPLLSG